MSKSNEIPFVALPVDIFTAIRDMLAEYGLSDKDEEFFENLGIKCGRAVVTRTGFSWESDEQLADALVSLWAEVGIGRLTAKDVDKGGVAAEVTDTVESLALGNVGEPSCHFTRGYIAGVVSELSSREHMTVEDQCVCEGHPKCVFTVIPL
jgi:predicted hydrocarbon binding protein